MLKKNLCITLFLLEITSAYAATLIWTGNGDGVSLFQEANWDAAGGTLTGDYIPKGPGITPHDLIITNGTVGGANGWGGTLDLGGTGSVTVNGGTFRMSATAAIKDGSASITDSNFGYIQGTLDNADFWSNWGLSLSGPMHLLNGSTLEATWFAGGSGVSSLDGASTLTIREDASGTFNNNTIDFLDYDSRIVYSDTGRTIAEVESEHLSRFTVNGAAAVIGKNISIYSDGVTGFTTVQAISAPPTFTWSGAGDGVSLFATNNWDPALNLGTDNFKNLPVPYSFIITNGTPGGANGWGGTLDLGGTGQLRIESGTTSFKSSTGGILKDGSLWAYAGNGAIDFAGTWNNMDVTIGSGIDTADTLNLVNGTTVDSQWCAYSSTTLNGASTLEVRGNGNVFAWGKVNLIDADSKIVFTGGKSVTDVVDQHLSGDIGDTGSSSAGRILINGLGAVQGFNVDVFTDTQSGYTTVQQRTKPPGPTYTSDGPNIIYIICDDLGYGDLGVLFQNSRADGQPKHATPQLDHMAAQGMQLHSHYCPAPVCAPSRSSLLSGVHQGHSEVRDNQFDKALANNHSLAGMLSTAGYKTAAFGKWGLQGNGTAPYWEAHPLNRGFDYFYGYMRHGDGHLHYPKEDGKEVYENYNQVNADLDKCYTTDLFTARAKKWITDHLASEEADKPMFLYLAYDTPHAKLQYPSTAYPSGGGLTGGVQWQGTAGSMINTATGTVDGYVHPEYMSATYDHDNNPGTAEIAWPDIAKRWAGGVRRVDHAVGDLLTLLDDLNIATNTLVIFTSDNGVTRESYLADAFEPGFFDSFGPFDGIKRDTWEGGIRMPALVYWPETIPSNSVSTTPSAFWDWMPTFAELAGQPAPAITDGVSLVPELTATGTRKESTIYVEYYEGGTTPAYSEFEPEHQGRRRNQMQVIQLKGFKGVRYNIASHADNFEIYDVINDPKETTNLATNPQFDGLQQRMKDRVLQLRRPNSTATRPYDNENIPPATSLAGYTNGLAEYAVFEGAWPWLPDFTAMIPSATGTVAGVDLSIKPVTNQYGILYTGCLDIPADGDYTFYLTSDHGANLRIHEALVIDDDYLHTGTEVSGTIKLKAGQHPFRLSYRHDGGSETLSFQYEGPGISKQPIPLSAYALDLAADTRSTYDAWNDVYGLSDGPYGDADGDLVNNLAEFAFNLNPTTNDNHIMEPGSGTTGLPYWNRPNSTNALTIEYLRRRQAPELAYKVWFTDSLITNWAESVQPEIVKPISPDWERVTVQDHIDINNATSRFGKIAVSITNDN